MRQIRRPLGQRSAVRVATLKDVDDAGGLVLSLQAGADPCVKNNYGLAGSVGPTNVADFGVRH